MTVDELWDEVKALVAKSSPPLDRLQTLVQQLAASREGRARFIQGMDPKEKTSHKGRLLRLLHRQIDVRHDPRPDFDAKERANLIRQATGFARQQWTKDAAYLAYLWLRIKTGERPAAADAKDDLRQLTKQLQTPEEMFDHLRGLAGWEEFPREMWVELLEEARNAELSSEFRPVLDRLVTVAKTAPNTPPRAAARRHAKPVDGATDVASKPPRSVEQQPAGHDGPSPAPARSAAGPAPAAQPPEGSRPTTRNRQSRGDDGASPDRTATAATVFPAEAPIPDSRGPDAPRAEPVSQRRHQGHRPSPVSGELDGVLRELTAAVHAMAGRLDQIASRADGAASLDQRLNELERRLAGVEKALTETRADAQRAREEADRLRARARDLEAELDDVRRDRDAATARSQELARNLAAATDRIATVERRADQNIHEAYRERDAAVLTFQARVWDAVRAQLVDVTDSTPGEKFNTTEEEVLTDRLRKIRDTLREEGIPPA
jgi:uncharacterized coiled-coil protein SlyX